MDNVFALSAAAAAAVPAVVGLVEVAKSVGLPSRFAPLASVAIGFAAAGVSGASSWQEVAARGTVIGLAACGLWSGGRAVAGKNGESERRT